MLTLDEGNENIVFVLCVFSLRNNSLADRKAVNERKRAEKLTKKKRRELKLFPTLSVSLSHRLATTFERKNG